MTSLYTADFADAEKSTSLLSGHAQCPVEKTTYRTKPGRKVTTEGKSISMRTAII